MPSSRTTSQSGERRYPWHRNPRLGLVASVLASMITCLVAVNGPSLVTLQLGPRRSLLPPWYVPTGKAFLNDEVAASLLWLAVILAAVGLGLCLRALRSGWRPRIKPLVALGVGLNAVTALVPPVTSGDVLMYASYGRLQALGQDPYSITPADIFRSQYDPVLRWTEQPWHDTPSVYGPIASFTQVLANWLGGESMHDVVFWLQVINLVPLIGLGLLCVAIARRDPAAQARAAMLTLCNPLLIWAVAAGAHNEALAVGFGVLGLTMMRRSPFLAGVGIGLAGCVKVSMVFYGVAMLWAYRREPKKMLMLCVGAATPMALCYGLWRPQALFAAARNTGYVSGGSWGFWVQGWLSCTVAGGIATRIVSVLALVSMVLVAIALNRRLPWRPIPRLRRGEDPRHDPLTDAARAAVVLGVAWLVTSPYTLSWYDLMAWAPLAVLAASPLDWILLWRGTALSLAYVVSRPLEMPVWLRKTSHALYWVSSYAQLGTLALIGWWWWHGRREERRERLIDAGA